MSHDDNKQKIKKGDVECLFCHSKNKNDYIVVNTRDNGTLYICYDCLDKIHSYQVEEKKVRFRKNITKKPMEIKEMLDEYIIGQETAKKVISVAVYNHYKRIQSGKTLRKSNILLSGPSGSGKTLLAQTMAQILDVPFVIADATSFTEAGYVGDDVESCLTALLQKSGNDPAVAETGIIYIDEIDKISRKGSNPSITRDVSGEGVQNALLKLIEGTTVDVPIQGKRRTVQNNTVQINTKNILFIFGGAFEGIKSHHNEKVVGFNQQVSCRKDTLELTAEDYIRFGMTPELMGRIPVIVELDELKTEDLIRILTEPKHSIIEEYQELFEMDGINLKFTEAALQRIAETSIEKKAGARGLKSILESIMLEIMYSAPSDTEAKEYIITEETIYTHEPLVIHSKQQCI